MSRSEPQPLHPYYPTNLAIPNYIANDKTVSHILAVFFSGVALVLALALATVTRKKYATHVFGWEKGVFVWFVMCGCVHTFFEGYFAAFATGLAGDNRLFGQLWKELSKNTHPDVHTLFTVGCLSFLLAHASQYRYALADSRYLVEDPTILYIERLTAFIEGPLCFVTASAMLTKAPYRHPLQISISIGQLYGTILYFATTIHEGSPHCDPRPFYVWFYFVFMNAWWVVIPSALIIQSFKAMVRGMEALSTAEAKQRVRFTNEKEQ